METKYLDRINWDDENKYTGNGDYANKEKFIEIEGYEYQGYEEYGKPVMVRKTLYIPKYTLVEIFSEIAKESMINIFNKKEE